MKEYEGLVNLYINYYINIMDNTHKITHCLWFDTQGREAADFYTSVFENATITPGITYSKAAAEASGKQEGDALTVDFQLENLAFTALNGGPYFKPSPAISFIINCESETEVDRFWKQLSQGGTVMMPLDKYDFSKKYGWIQDRFGISWQVMLTDPEGDWRPKLTPCLLFTGKKSGKTREAIELYTSVFKNTGRGSMFPYEQPGQEDKTMFADFSLEGQWIAAMDSPQDDPFDFTEGNSIMVHCDTQNEIDYYWGKLTENGGQEEQCGWLKDKFGVSWQIIPRVLPKLLSDPDPEKSKKATEAMMQMKKIDINILEEAHGAQQKQVKL